MGTGNLCISDMGPDEVEASAGGVGNPSSREVRVSIPGAVLNGSGEECTLSVTVHLDVYGHLT